MSSTEKKYYRVTQIKGKVSWQVEELWSGGMIRGPYNSSETAISNENKIAQQEGFINDLELKEIIADEDFDMGTEDVKAESFPSNRYNERKMGDDRLPDLSLEPLLEKIDTYSPSGKINLLCIPLLLLFGSSLGIGVAFIIHLIWQATGFYFIVLFPTIIAYAAGFGLGIGNRLGKCRNLSVGLSLGLIVGLISYVSMHFFDSMSYGTTNLLTYLNALAKEGFELFLIIPVTGFFAWIVWIIEIGIVLYSTVKFGGNVSSMPFCESCNKWADERKLFTTSNTYDTKKGLLQAIADNEYGEFKGLKNSNFTESYKINTILHHCDNLSHNGYITLEEIYPKDKKDETEKEILLWCAIVPADNVAKLLNDFPVTDKNN
ncbi:MAG TPA: hypothetical protein G4O15_06235 [Dehalococcoidia bacterium]|nr:hypothetical protein [Dehalococcoidia bacterium]